MKDYIVKTQIFQYIKALLPRLLSPPPPPPNKKRERMNRAPEQTQNTVLIPQAEGGLADPSTTPAGSRSLHWIWIGRVCVKILRHCLQ